MKTSLTQFLITTSLILCGINSQCLLPRLPVPFTTLCFCPKFWGCKGTKVQDPFCQCACPPGPPCALPKEVNQDDCICKCKVDYDCPAPKYVDVDTCDCLCPKKQCRANQIQSQTTCDCECPNKGIESPLLKKFDDLTCSLVCRLPAICLNPDQVWDSFECKCVFKNTQLPPNNQQTKEASAEDNQDDLESDDEQSDESEEVAADAQKQLEESDKKESGDQQK